MRHGGRDLAAQRRCHPRCSSPSTDPLLEAQGDQSERRIVRFQYSVLGEFWARRGYSSALLQQRSIERAESLRRAGGGGGRLSRSDE
jgi:hypothetical protein